MALRARLEGVANVSISQSQQTASVEFADEAREFSPRVLRDAITGAGMEVLGLRLDACGVVEQQDAQRWLVAGGNRLLLEKGESAPVGPIVCVSGTLDDRSDPHRLQVTSIDAG